MGHGSHSCDRFQTVVLRQKKQMAKIYISDLRPAGALFSEEAKAAGSVQLLTPEELTNVKGGRHSCPRPWWPSPWWPRPLPRPRL